MDDTAKSVAIIKRAIRKHWKNGGKIVFGTWGVRQKAGKWVAYKNCCALACVLDGKPVVVPGLYGRITEWSAAEEIVDHGIQVSNFIWGFDEPKTIYTGKWERAGNNVRQWVKENQPRATKK